MKSGMLLKHSHRKEINPSDTVPRNIESGRLLMRNLVQDEKLQETPKNQRKSEKIMLICGVYTVYPNFTCFPSFFVAETVGRKWKPFQKSQPTNFYHLPSFASCLGFRSKCSYLMHVASMRRLLGFGLLDEAQGRAKPDILSNRITSPSNVQVSWLESFHMINSGRTVWQRLW